MGISLSSSSSSPQRPPTAKLILADGALREYEHPVKVAHVLTQGFFLCLSDSINFNQYLSPLPAHHELQLDRLYFLLPLIKLKYPLLPSVMHVVDQEMDGRPIHKSDSYRFNEFRISAVESKRIISRQRKFEHKQSWRSKLTPIPEAFAY